MSHHTTEAMPSPDTTTAARPSTERVIWWIVFGALILSIILMLGAWN